MDADGKREILYSPTNSQQTVSDDDEIDYSVKPEFYDSELDDKDEVWVQKKRKGHNSDAVLSCPACFTTLCLECQRHERYVTQYRAVFVVNCKIDSNEVQHCSQKPKRGKRRRRSDEPNATAAGRRSDEPNATAAGRRSDEPNATAAGAETFKPVCCSVCSTEVGVIDGDEVYHFFNVLPSES